MEMDNESKACLVLFFIGIAIIFYTLLTKEKD